MTETILNSVKLFELLRLSQDERKSYLAQLTENGLGFNTSDLYSTLIKEAARCNCFNSDVVYDIEFIESRFHVYSGKEFEPLFIGFRKLGVDGTDYSILRLKEYDNPREGLLKEYFAFYSITLELANYEGFYNVILTKYDC